MQRFIPLCCTSLLLAFASCHEASQTAAVAAAETDSAGRLRSYEMADFDFARFEGTYGGDFGGSGDIRIAIRHAGGRHAVGYSLHKGLRRNISGDMIPAGDGFDFKLAEPGDNPYDGLFEFHIDTARFALKGKWTPAATDKLSPKTFSLARMAIDSGSNGGEWTYSDSLGDLALRPEGLCSYSYYNRKDGREVGQLITVTGNWRQEGEQLLIDWQPNSVFPSRKSTFRIFREEWADDKSDPLILLKSAVYLKGEGRELHPMEDY